MDFFNYASIASAFTSELWVILLVGGLCFALIFTFQGVALYTIAGREGYQNKWMAFVPFLNTYYIGVCAQKNRFYKLDTKKVAISAAVFEGVLVALYLFYYITRYAVLEANGYIGYITQDSGLGYWIEVPFIRSDLPESLNWAAWVAEHLNDYVIWYIDIVYVLLNAVLLICFFQTYACNRYVLFTITSILFPIQGILFFVVRNNKGMNYREFILKRQARQYQLYQQQQQQYYNQNPYSRNPYDGNPYNGNPYDQNRGPHTSSGTKTDDPFGDFGGNGSDGNGGGNDGGGSSPFDEFDN